MTVTMVPRDLSNEFHRQKRLDAFNDKIGLTHWPQEFNKSGFGTFAKNIQSGSIKYEWPRLTP